MHEANIASDQAEIKYAWTSVSRPLLTQQDDESRSGALRESGMSNGNGLIIDDIEDPEEEQNEIQERLKDMRLDLLAELQEAAASNSGQGGGSSGDVSPLMWSRMPSRAGYGSESEHSDGTSQEYLRHLKPPVTVGISSSRFQHLRRKKSQGNYAALLFVLSFVRVLKQFRGLRCNVFQLAAACLENENT